MRRVVGRAGWSFADQVISSGTNAAVSFIVANAMEEEAFGAFLIAFIVFSLSVGVSRTIATAPLGIRFAHTDGAEFRKAVADATGAALVFGAIVGVVTVIAGLTIGGNVGTALVAVAIPLPALLVQDAWRYAFFTQSRPALAVANDGVWAIVQLIGLAIATRAGVATPAPFILVWGGAALVAAAYGVAQTGVLMGPAHALRWVRTHIDLTRNLTTEFVTLQASSQGTILLLAAIGGETIVAALRGAQLLLAPATLLAVSVSALALPEFSRRRASLTPSQYIRGAMGVSAAVTALGLAWGALFYLVPDAFGESLLGKSWPSAQAVLLATIVGQAGAALSIGPATMLYAMQRAATTLRINAAQAILVAGFGITGGTVADAEGAAWGIAASFWAVVPAWWIFVRRWAKRTHVGSGAADSSERNAHSGGLSAGTIRPIRAHRRVLLQLKNSPDEVKAVDGIRRPAEH